MFKLYALILGYLLIMASCNQAANSNSTKEDLTNTEGTDPQATDIKNYNKPSESVKNNCAAPTNMRELSGGMEKLFYQFTSSNEANLSVFGMASAKLSKKEVVVVVDFIQFKA